jgi:hypothetical protein
MIDEKFLSARIRDIWQIQRRAEKAKDLSALKVEVANIAVELTGLMEALKPRK